MNSVLNIKWYGNIVRRYLHRGVVREENVKDMLYCTDSDKITYVDYGRFESTLSKELYYGEKKCIKIGSRNLIIERVEKNKFREAVIGKYGSFINDFKSYHEKIIHPKYYKLSNDMYSYAYIQQSQDLVFDTVRERKSYIDDSIEIDSRSEILELLVSNRNGIYFDGGISVYIPLRKLKAPEGITTVNINADIGIIELPKSASFVEVNKGRIGKCILKSPTQANGDMVDTLCCADEVEINTSLIKCVENRAFMKCRYSELNFPQIVSIGNSAFDGCTARKITLGSNLLYLSYAAFAACNAEEIIFKSDIFDLYDNQFTECENLRRVGITKNISQETNEVLMKAIESAPRKVEVYYI